MGQQITPQTVFPFIQETDLESKRPTASGGTAYNETHIL